MGIEAESKGYEMSNASIDGRGNDDCHQLHNLTQWTYIFITIGAVSLILNLYVIKVVARKQTKVRWKHKPSLLVLSLACTDLLLGVSCLLMNILPLVLTLSDIYLLLVIDYHIIMYSVLNSLLHVFTMTIERFVAIRFPFIYKEKMTCRKILIIIITNWILSLNYLFMLLNFVTFQKFLSMLIFVVGVALLTIYIYIFRNIRKIMVRRRNSIGSGRISATILRREIFSAIYCATIVFAFIFCSFPNAVNQFRLDQCDYEDIEMITTTILVGNTIFNPLLWILSEKCKAKSKRSPKRSIGSTSMSMSAISHTTLEKQ